jgi:hypothetical protein
LKNNSTEANIMPSFAAVTIYAFGISAFSHGVASLVWQKDALAKKKLAAPSLPALNSFSVVIIGIGIYYCLAAYQENRAFFAMTLARFISAKIFWSQGPAWRTIATWEALSAAVTSIALVWDLLGEA